MEAREVALYRGLPLEEMTATNPALHLQNRLNFAFDPKNVIGESRKAACVHVPPSATTGRAAWSLRLLRKVAFARELARTTWALPDVAAAVVEGFSVSRDQRWFQALQ